MGMKGKGGGRLLYTYIEIKGSYKNKNANKKP